MGAIVSREGEPRDAVGGYTQIEVTVKAGTGIHLWGRRVAEVTVKGGAASNKGDATVGGLLVGDRILAVNGDAVTAGAKHARRLIQAAGCRAVCSVGRPVDCDLEAAIVKSLEEHAAASMAPEHALVTPRRRWSNTLSSDHSPSAGLGLS